jgi:vacuolar-type H+-ATPase subunit F/Vma7
MIVPDVPRAGGDAPAIVFAVWTERDEDYGFVWVDRDDAERNAQAFRDDGEPASVHTLTRVPSPATLDARIAALERMRRAVELLAWFTDPHDRAPLHVIHEAENIIGEIEGTIGGHDETVTALLTDLRAARDAAGRDVASGNPSPEQAP